MDDWPRSSTGPEQPVSTRQVADSNSAVATKRCPKCTEIKPATLEFFYAGKKWRDGFKPYCKACQIAHSVAWKKANPAKATQARKAWTAKNPLWQRGYQARWRKENLPLARDRDRKKSAKRRECALFRLHHNIRSRIYKSLKGGKGGRSWESIVGYALADLSRHLERQFQPGMTWKNIGEWHIDHIVPVSAFQFLDENDPEFKACWALTNLRPMWARANLIKNAKRIYLI